jgi:DNA mismatch repair protein MutS2
MEPLDWQEIVACIKKSATSEKAKLKIQNIEPLATAELAIKRLDQVFSAHEILSTAGQRPFFESLDLYDSWFVKLKKGACLKPIELKDLRYFCMELLALRVVLGQSSSHANQMLLQSLFDAESSLSAIDQLISPSAEIRSDASETLYKLFKEKESLAKQINATMEKLVKDFDIQEYLQDRFVTTREGRWVIPVKSGRQHAVSGVVHGSSQTKQTVYLEPEKIIPLNNRLREVELEIEEEIERLLQSLSHYLHQFSSQFEMAHDTMLNCDVLFAIAQFSSLIEGSRFEFFEGSIEIENVRHPLMVYNQKQTVPNTIELGNKKHILLLSGPNAGGKTVLMKSIGLVCHMARCGLPVCATQAKIPFFKNILVSIGDSQKVDEELSTFAAHLKLLNQASQLKGFQSLILIDEIASSTDPEEGSALAKAFIEEFSENSVFAVITSHLNQLKSGWTSDGPVLIGSLEFDLKESRPTYQFLPGVPGQSLALEMAKRLKISSKILNRAYELLSPESKLRLEILSETENLKHELIQLQDGLKKARQEAENEKLKYQNKIQQLEDEREKELGKVIQEGRRKIEDIVSELKAADSLERHRKSQEIKFQLPEIIKGSSNKNQSLASNPQNKEEFKHQCPPGTKVYIRNMKKEGIVQSEPNAKGEVMVLMDSMRLAIQWVDLERTGNSKNPTQNILRQKGLFHASPETDPQIDLRGLTVSEAIEKVDSSLDQAMQFRRGRVRLVHGVGTESLKKALRSHLTRSPFVRKWSSARPEEGGEGVTWVELDLE